MNKIKRNEYVDKNANMIVLGHLFRNPSILENREEYTIIQDDFLDRLHKIVYVGIANLFADGLVNINEIDIYNYIQNAMPDELKYFEERNGIEFIRKIAILSESGEGLKYYYDRMKKFTLLRTYIKYGVEVEDFYNPSIIDFDERAKQENRLQSNSIEDIIDIIDSKIEKVKTEFQYEGNIQSELMGSDVLETLEKLKETPSVGLPLPFGYLNTITSGARLKKFYLTSAGSGKGKTRYMVGSAVYLSCGEIFNSETNKWEKLKWKEPTLFISTELEKEEVQTMALAFISNVNESKILGTECISFEEQERVMKAAKILSNAPLFLDVIPDFSVEDIERSIKLHIEKKNVKYVFYDYIHSSVKLLAEISQATKGMRLREDNVLFMLSVKLKDICNKYGVFIQSGTQVNRSGNGSDDDATSNMLRGASSIADKADFGEILSSPSEKDMEAYERLKMQLPDTTREPNIIRGIYKNRRNKYTNGKLWCYADLGTCRFTPLFYTTNNYQLVDLPLLDIEVTEDVQ